MQLFRNKKILFAFVLPFTFWIYLALSSNIRIVHDSAGFENGGKRLKSDGLRGYLEHEPEKEPLYSYSMSLSMKLADVLGVDYKKIQTCFQILLLLLGQIFLYRILLHLKLSETVTTIALFYYGLSPGLISCGFDLYSEIVTLPFVLLSVLFMSKAWRFSLQENIKSFTLYALLFTLTATGAVFSKAVLIVLYPLFVLPFVILLIYSFFKRKKRQGQCAIIFLIIFFAIFNTSINGYKSLNQKYHGSYVFTDDRGGPMLYTLAIKRTAPLTKEALGIAILSIPGQNVCSKFYGQACSDWLYWEAYNLGFHKRGELVGENVGEEKIRKIMISSSIKQILSNPFQYSLFAFLEASKMFFWESTKIGFVTYPDWLTKIHNNVIFKNVLRLFIALITLFSTAYMAIYIFKNRRKLRDISDEQSERYQYSFFLFFFLILFIGLYSSVMTVTRYSLPIAPLFIVLIAFMANQKFQKFLR